MIVIHSQHMPGNWDENTHYYAPPMEVKRTSLPTIGNSSISKPIEQEETVKGKHANCLLGVNTERAFHDNSCLSHPNLKKIDQGTEGMAEASVEYP